MGPSVCVEAVLADENPMYVVRMLGLLCLNLGWLIPGYLCIHSLRQWCRVEASPVVYGIERQLNSFPFLRFSEEMLAITTIWLGLVLGYHTLSHSRRQPRRTAL
jgi:hypothetical protein